MPTGMDPQKLREMEAILTSLRNKPADDMLSSKMKTG